MSLKKKVALITGAASGIGRATAVQCLKKGINVSMVDINSEQGEKVLEELRALYGNDSIIFLRADVRSEDEFEEAFETTIEAFGKIDIVVNNSGLWDKQMWVKMIEVNLMGVIYGTKLAIKYMSKESGNAGGVIINMGSISGIEIYPFLPEYSASKFGVMGYTMCCAADKNNLNKHGIRINLVCPGKVETPLLEKILANNDLANVTPSMQPVHIARAVLYLIEDEMRNGLILKVVDEDKFTVVQPTVNTVEIITPE